MENETVLLILKIIGSLCFWYFVLKYLFKGIKALYQRFIKKQPVDISFETPMSDEEKMKIAQEVSENNKTARHNRNPKSEIISYSRFFI